jgi:phage-related minor tail protein
MGDWDVQIEDSTGLMDKLFFAGQATGIGFDGLAAKLVQFGAPLRQFDFSVEESIALLGKWELEGVNTELVLGSLRVAMGNFARDGIPMRQGLEDIIEQITELGPGAAATALAMEIFGARAGPDMAATILEGRFAIDDLVEAIDGSGGALQDAAERAITFGERVEVMKSKAMVALIPIGDALLELAEYAMPLVMSAIFFLQQAVEMVMPYFDEFTKTIEFVNNMLGNGVTPFNAFIRVLKRAGLEGFAELVVRAKEFGETLLETIQPVIDFVSETFELSDVLIALGIAILSVVIPAIGGMVLAMLPIIATAFAVIAAVALLRTAWEENWGGIQEKTETAMGAISEKAPAMWEEAKTRIGNSWAAIQAFWDYYGPLMEAGFRMTWEALKAIGRAGATFLEGLYEKFLAWVATAWEMHG